MSESYREPETPEEWQEAADFARTCLLIHASVQYGLITGVPGVNVDRCQEILDQAADQEIYPHSDAVDRCLPVILKGDCP